MRMLGLMASALAVIPLGHLFMRKFQRWVASLGLNPSVHSHWRVRVTQVAVRALERWPNPSFLTEGVPMGIILSRKVVTTDASLTG